MAFTPFDYMPNYGAMQETEEERRRREAEQQAAESQVQPVSPQDFGAMPMQEQPMAGIETDFGARAAELDIGTVPMPGPGVQVAGPAQLPGAVSPQQMAQQQQLAQQPQMAAPTYQGPGQGAEAQTVSQPMPAPVPAPAAQMAAPAQQAQQAQPAADPIGMFTAAVGDTNKLFQVYNDTSLPPELRRIAGREAGRQLDSETKRVQAEQEIKNMSQADLANLLRSKSEEGSWGKRVLFGVLGMEAAVKDEEAKLGIGAKYQSTTVNGQPVLVKVRADGVPMEGYDATTGKQLNNKELVAATAGLTVAKGTQAATATRVRDSKGTEWSQVPTTQGMKFYNNQGQAGVPEGRTVPISAGTDLELEQAKADIKTISQFSGQTAQARLNAYENTNKLRADRGLPPKTLEEMGLNSDGSLIGEATRRPGAAPAAAPAPMAAAPAAGTRPVAAAERTPAVTAQAAPGGGVRLSVGGGGGGAAAPAAGGRIPTAAEMQEQSKESDLNRTLREAAAKAQINVAQNLEEQKNKVRTAMPASEGNVVRILTTLNDIVTHPGLDKTVGLPRILATPLEMIPGGDQRNFAQKFKQLGGQEFLAAYNELRGGGGISEVEGLKAEQAISALKDTGISPAEFRKNMWILQDAVKSGFDRQRELVGQPAKYRESPEREAAKEWLRNNPNNPKAAAVRRKLVGF
jgi:hypothetical protein